MNKIFISFALAVTILSLTSCKEDENQPGKITLTFEEIDADGIPFVFNTAGYMNEAGNVYIVTEVQYFISNLKIYYKDGTSFTITDDQGIHYRDTDIPETRKWIIEDEVPSGLVDSLVFTFGLDEETNQPGLFVNPPESNMFWPDELGGGYHYMKLNGKWETGLEWNPFNFHLGIGQTYDTLGNVTGFVQNYFRVSVSLPVTSSYIIDIEAGKTTDLSLYMNIDSWFKTPHTWDFNQWGGMIMQNQQAMRTACENGYDVFSIGPFHEW